MPYMRHILTNHGEYDDENERFDSAFSFPSSGAKRQLRFHTYIVVISKIRTKLSFHNSYLANSYGIELLACRHIP